MVILSSANGPSSGAFRVTYTDGTIGSFPVTIADWCDKPVDGTTVALAMDHRIKDDKGKDDPATSLFHTSIPVPAGKQVRVVELPSSARMAIYAVTLT